MDLTWEESANDKAEWPQVWLSAAIWTRDELRSMQGYSLYRCDMTTCYRRRSDNRFLRVDRLTVLLVGLTAKETVMRVAIQLYTDDTGSSDLTTLRNWTFLYHYRRLSVTALIVMLECVCVTITLSIVRTILAWQHHKCK